MDSKMRFYQIRLPSVVCAVVESEMMAQRVSSILNMISIFILGRVPTAELDNWITDFKERIFKRYWVLTDMDYNGALGAALSFLAIKKFHPLAEIFGKKNIACIYRRKIIKYVCYFLYYRLQNRIRTAKCCHGEIFAQLQCNWKTGRKNRWARRWPDPNLEIVASFYK